MSPAPKTCDGSNDLFVMSLWFFVIFVFQTCELKSVRSIHDSRLTIYDLRLSTKTEYPSVHARQPILGEEPSIDEIIVRAFETEVLRSDGVVALVLLEHFLR